MNEGPTFKEVPSYRERVCNGCKHLHTSAMLRGHNKCTNNYSCQHGDFINEYNITSGKGRLIHFNHEGSCDTPQWCPFLKTLNS